MQPKAKAQQVNSRVVARAIDSRTLPLAPRIATTWRDAAQLPLVAPRPTYR